MKTAEQFLEEVVNKPVYYYVYGYYDEKLDTFHQPFFSKDEPAFMYEQLKGGLLKGQIKIADMLDMNLVLFGVFDLKKGNFEIKDVNDYQIICRCNDFIKLPENGGNKDA